MVKRCAWGTCNSDSRYKDKEYMRDVTFWPIPKPKTRLRETLVWVKACNRKNFTVKNVNKHAYVCSKHFVEGQPTEKYPYPVIAGSSSQGKPLRKPPTKKANNHETTTTTKLSRNVDIETVPTPAAFIVIDDVEDIATDSFDDIGKNYGDICNIHTLILINVLNHTHRTNIESTVYFRVSFFVI